MQFYVNHLKIKGEKFDHSTTLKSYKGTLKDEQNKLIYKLPLSSDEGNGPGRKIAPNTGANATKFFTLATKS